MPTTFFTATHVLTADAAVLPPVFSGTALAPACVVMERCRRGKKARQGKGKGKKRLPAAKSAMAKSTNPPSSSSTPATPSQPYNTMHHDTVPRRLESIAIADTLMDPPRSRPGKPSSTSSSVPVRLLQVARQSNLIEHYYCQPAYMPILHHPPCSLPYPERCRQPHAREEEQ
jgi:hypothetical protein